MVEKKSTHRYPLPKILSTFEGYEELIKLYSFADMISEGRVLIDFQGEEFDVNLSGILWCVVEQLVAKDIPWALSGVSDATIGKWQSNGFSSKFSHLEKKQVSKTVKYIEISQNKLVEMTDYIDDEIFSNNDFPKMSQQLHKRFNESIVELAQNSFMHGKAKKVICCGNYLPDENILEFSITNLGTTFRENFDTYIQKLGINSIDVESSIDWATQEGNTTVPGMARGLGLGILKSFIDHNSGSIQIMSGNEFWERRNCVNVCKKFKNGFLGTCVVFEFNLADHNAYRLKGEVG